MSCVELGLNNIDDSKEGSFRNYWFCGNLLYLFMRNPGKVLTYHTILQKIWGDGYGVDTQVLRSVMASTRRKIENNPAKPEYILTEIGIGYRMRERDK